MRRNKPKPNYRKIVLRLPDLDHADDTLREYCAFHFLGVWLLENT
jgi:hypothetical protein